MTTLRSIPCGRGGAGGNSPAAMRSVQSPNIASARSRPSALRPPLICAPAWPDWMRRSHASIELWNVPSSFGISRVPFVPS